MALNKKHKDTMLIIDIGTATVSAALVVLSPRAAPRLEMMARLPLISGSETARAALGSRLEPAVTELLGKFVKTSPRHVRVVLAAPWFAGAIRTITSSFEKDAPISERVVQRLLERYRNEKPARSGNVDIEALAVQVKVNGYPTELAHAVSGRELAVNFYESETDAATERSIRRAAERAFPHASISYHTFPLVATVALRTLLNETSFALVDIAGEVTEIAVVHGDGIQHLSSFPVGYFTLARSFGGKKDAVGDALSRLALFGRGELSEAEAPRAEKAFEKAFAAWLEPFEVALKGASDTVPIPQKLFLISDREHVPWLKKGLSAHNTFAVSLEEIGAPMVQNMVALGDNTGPYDVFLSLEALFFHTYKAALIGE